MIIMNTQYFFMTMAVYALLSAFLVKMVAQAKHIEPVSTVIIGASYTALTVGYVLAMVLG
jgi:hypothetical protein